MIRDQDTVKEREGDDEQALLQEIRERAAYGSERWDDNFKAAEQDIAFLAGEQWPKSVLEERSEEDRPCLTLNKLPQYVDQVLGDQRQNRPAIHVHAVEDNVTPMAQQQVPEEAGFAEQARAKGKLPNTAGNQDYSLAEVYESLIRNIEYTSNAEAHYDSAFQHAVESGFGWLRVITHYQNDDTFDQDAKIEHIPNRFNVIIDPDCREPDYSDAGWGFVIERMKHKQFRKKYPNKSLGDLSDATNTCWVTEDHVSVAEYFWREPATRNLLLLSDGKTVWRDEVKDVLDELEENGITVIRERKVKTYKVMWMKCTAQSVLEKPREWPGRTVPLVPVLGKEMMFGDQKWYRGLIRFAKDAQRMHNFWMTAATERVALAPKAPWIASDDMVDGRPEWDDANKKNYSVLKYNAQPDGSRPVRDMPAQMPAAELQLALSATDELKATVGIYDASIGAQSNETSGKAILARQRQGDRGTFAYIDNLSRAIRRVGQILIEVIPRIYDGERVLRLRFADESGDWVKINETVRDMETGKDVLVHDIAAGKFDVTVKSGPSYATQRLEAADSLLQFVQAVPSSASVVLDLIAQNMDWPGAKDIARRLKKIVPPGVLDADEMEEAGIQAPQPTPEQQAEAAKAEATMAKAQSDQQVAQMQIEEAQLSLETAKAKAAAAQASIDKLAAPDDMKAAIRVEVAEALAEFIAAQKDAQ